MRLNLILTMMRTGTLGTCVCVCVCMCVYGREPIANRGKVEESCQVVPPHVRSGHVVTHMKLMCVYIYVYRCMCIDTHANVYTYTYVHIYT